MANCAIVGINWGDEGKGRFVDFLAKDADMVIRYQGGNNAGHTVINEYGKFALHLQSKARKKGRNRFRHCIACAKRMAAAAPTMPESRATATVARVLRTPTEPK